MYKRRAHFLFVGPPERTRDALEVTEAHVADWIEGAALTRTQSDPALMAWADVCVLLDDGPVFAGKTCRRWQLAENRTVRTQELVTALEGAVGGLRLLARSDPPE